MTAGTPVRPATDRYHLTLTCPRCGSLMRPVADGKPQENGRTISAIARCSGDCRPMHASWQIMVRLLPLHDQKAHH